MSDLTPEQLERFNEALALWQARSKPLVDAIRAAERITSDDLNIRMTI